MAKTEITIQIKRTIPSPNQSWGKTEMLVDIVETERYLTRSTAYLNKVMKAAKRILKDES